MKILPQASAQKAMTTRVATELPLIMVFFMFNPFASLGKMALVMALAVMAAYSAFMLLPFEALAILLIFGVILVEPLEWAYYAIAGLDGYDGLLTRFFEKAMISYKVILSSLFIGLAAERMGPDPFLVLFVAGWIVPITFFFMETRMRNLRIEGDDLVFKNRMIWTRRLKISKIKEAFVRRGMLDSFFGTITVEIIPEGKRKVLRIFDLEENEARKFFSENKIALKD